MEAKSSATANPKARSRRPDRIHKDRKVQWQQWPETDPKYDALKLDDLHCIRPDLEDSAVIAWGLELSERQRTTGEDVDISVLYGTGTDLRWDPIKDDAHLSRILEVDTQTSTSALRVCFIDTFKTNTGWLPGNFSPRSETVRVLRRAGLSGILLSNLYSEQSYWAKMGNQRFMKYDSNGELESFEVCYQYRCGWDTGVSFIHAVRTRTQTTYFCINYPYGARQRLQAVYKEVKTRDILHRDFFIDTLVADDSLKQWQFDIGERRLELLEYEKDLGVESEKKPSSLSKTPREITRNASKAADLSQWAKIDAEEQGKVSIKERRKTRTGEPKDNPLAASKGSETSIIDFDTPTQRLHRLVRHWLGLRQDCEDLLAQLKFLHSTYDKIKDSKNCKLLMAKTVDAGESFETLESQCDICVRWTQVYHDRTQTRIGLLFHLANQRTADDTAKIAVQTQRDSASMITIAAVTMLFLPGTFVCTIVSTNLFDFGEDGLQVSNQWWILLAAAIPLTFVVFGIWLGWQRMRSQSQRQKERLKATVKRLEAQLYAAKT